MERRASELVVMYLLIMVGTAFTSLQWLDYVLAGLLGHVSYAVGLLWYYGTLEFYLGIDFWARWGIITR